MAKSNAQTVEQYLEELPEYRRDTIKEIREFILEHLPDGYNETINWGMISYEIPLDHYPDTYNDQPLSYLGLAAQANHNSLYLMPVYQDEELQDWLEEEFKKANKKMDMGRSCLRFVLLRTRLGLLLAQLGRVHEGLIRGQGQCGVAVHVVVFFNGYQVRPGRYLMVLNGGHAHRVGSNNDGSPRRLGVNGDR